ncbi:hypothetical protein Tco_0315349, partial [Tanacetum coccineum]
MGCSQVPIPCKVTSFQFHTQRRTVGKWSFNNYTYGFLVKKVGNMSCEEAILKQEGAETSKVVMY